MPPIAIDREQNPQGMTAPDSKPKNGAPALKRRKWMGAPMP
jgi:hypothetical protein